jgi:hypothetical protein
VVARDNACAPSNIADISFTILPLEMGQYAF